MAEIHDLAIPESYEEMLALFPWIRVQPHEWEKNTYAQNVAALVEKARELVYFAEGEKAALEKRIADLKDQERRLLETPVFKVVPGARGGEDIYYEDEVVIRGEKKKMPFRIMNPQSTALGRAVLRLLKDYHDLLESATAPKKKPRDTTPAA
jgi:hypothetical protein